MAKIAISTSSGLKATEGLSLSVSSVQNNGATAESAPVLMSVESTDTLNAEGLATAIHAHAPDLSESECRFVVNAMEEALVDIVTNATSPVNIQLGFATFLWEVSGSLDSADGTPNPLTNVPFMTGLVPERYRKVFASYDAYVPTGDQPCVLKRVRDKATNVGAIFGTAPFRLEGRGMTYGSTGETLELWDELMTTKVCDLTVVSHASEILFECKIPGTVAIPVGTYRVKLVTLAGGAGTGAPLYTVDLKATLAEAVVPQPAVTKVKEGTREDDLVGFHSSNQYLISGLFPEGWKTSDQLIVRSLRDGQVYATMTANEFVNAAESTAAAIKLNKLENLSAEPDSEWNNHPAEFVFKRGDVEYKHSVSWLNA